MKKLIDAEKLMELLRKERYCCPEEFYEIGYNAGMDDAVKAVEGMPAEETPKKAHWELTQHLHGVLHGRLLDLVVSKCSACGEYAAGNTTMLYCMNCGAKMGGDAS